MLTALDFGSFRAKPPKENRAGNAEIAFPALDSGGSRDGIVMYFGKRS
jgi:hypothetical protein